jgi:hypothetical protein
MPCGYSLASRFERLSLCTRTHGVTEFVERDACLSEIVKRLQMLEVSRLSIESRQDDRYVRRTIQRVRSDERLLVFDHVEPIGEPILWIADAVTWAVGSAAPWSNLVEGLVVEIVEVRPV